MCQIGRGVLREAPFSHFASSRLPFYTIQLSGTPLKSKVHQELMQHNQSQAKFFPALKQTLKTQNNFNTPTS